MSIYDKPSEIEYAKKLEKRILKARLSQINGSILDLGELLFELKTVEAYRFLGYEKFKDWYEDWEFPYQSVNHWLNIFTTYIINLNFNKQELSDVDVRVLKAFLPVARSNAATKNKLKDLIDKAIQMKFDKFLDLLPEIKRSFGL